MAAGGKPTSNVISGSPSQVEPAPVETVAIQIRSCVCICIGGATAESRGSHGFACRADEEMAFRYQAAMYQVRAPDSGVAGRPDCTGDGLSVRIAPIFPAITLPRSTKKASLIRCWSLGCSLLSEETVDCNGFRSCWVVNIITTVGVTRPRNWKSSVPGRAHIAHLYSIWRSASWWGVPWRFLVVGCDGGGYVVVQG